jgi:tetratricopeptide (TPR) repeat protein
VTVSLALIVRNAERTLPRCLASVDGAVDEIVVVDTGSTDGTKAVARRYTDRVLDCAWHDDFGAARQFAFDQARGDWVGWLDADDVVTGGEHIRPLCAAAAQEVGAFYWRYVCARDAWGNVACEFWRERLVRNDGSFRWAGRIHEALVPRRACATARTPEIVVEHHPEPERAEEKLRRNLAILEAERAAAGDDVPARLLFYLGRDYRSAGDYQRALGAFRQCLRRSEWADERYLAQTYVADVYRTQQRYQQALAADLHALRLNPHWPDAYFGLARSYYFLRDWPKVVHWTDVGRALPPPDTLHIVNPLDYQFNWIIYYTNALYQVGARAEALDWTRRALAIQPGDPWHQHNLAFFAEEAAGVSDG